MECTRRCSVHLQVDQPSCRYPRNARPIAVAVLGIREVYSVILQPGGRFYFAGDTTPTLSTPLHAMYTRPSDVAAMLRTTPPPEGIFALANVCVFGLNCTIVFGCTPDSLYQTIPSGVIAMP